MRFEKIIPNQQLRQYVDYFVISENADQSQYKVLPSTSLVIGFQYQGTLSRLNIEGEQKLAKMGITGLQDHFHTFKSSANISSILVFFKPIGAANFFKNPVHELFNESLSLDLLCEGVTVERISAQLEEAENDKERILVIERFLISQLIDKKEDRLVKKAVELIYEFKGNLKISTLVNMLSTSQSPLEKRFRSLVGASPKKFAAIVRFNQVIKDLSANKPITSITFENNYYDQSHFINDFKKFSGETPEKFLK